MVATSTVSKVRIVDPDEERNPSRGLGPAANYPLALVGQEAPVLDKYRTVCNTVYKTYIFGRIVEFYDFEVEEV